MSELQLERETREEYARLSDAAHLAAIKTSLAEHADAKTRLIRSEIARIAPVMDEMELCAILSSLVSAIGKSACFTGCAAAKTAEEYLLDAVSALEGGV